MTRKNHGQALEPRGASMRFHSQRPSFDLIVIVASAGGIQALLTILKGLPADFPVPIAIVQHRSATLPNYLPEVLGRNVLLKVKIAENRETLRAGVVYLAPPDQHLVIRSDHTFGLFDGMRIRHVLSSANPLFASAAEILKDRVIAIVLTGMDRDGTDGVQAVHAAGGLVYAQNEETSEFFAMPHSAIGTGCVDRVLPVEEIAPALISLVTSSTEQEGRGISVPRRKGPEKER